MLAAEAAVFAELQLCGLGFLVFGCRIISLFALGAAKGDYVSHLCILCMGLRLKLTAILSTCLIDFRFIQ
jgi:hypothetical protein